MKSYRVLAFALAIIAATGSAAASPADLTIFPEHSSTEVNSFTSYEVTVENIGPVKDVYTLSSRADQVRIAPRQVELEPGQEETVNVWYNPPVTQEEGTYSFNVNAKSRANGKTFSVEGTVDVIKDHKVDVQLDSMSKTGCLNQKVTYQVSVTNNGIQKEEFALDTNYGRLTRDRVTLEEGETQTLKLVASSSRPVQKNFNVIAASTTSYAQDIENVQFNAETCYASDVSITPQSQRTAALTPAEYQVTVRNTGTKADNFVLSATKGELEDTEFTIPGKSTASTTLTYTPSKLGRQAVTVTAESTVQSSATATAEVFNGQDVEVSFESSRRTTCEGGQTTYDVTVTNTGAAADTYTLNAGGGQLSEDEVELEPGESEEVELTVNAGDHPTGKEVTVAVNAGSQAFKQTRHTGTARFLAENCWDLQMNVVPKIASAGENRSVVYEIQLENTGTRQNTYDLSYTGPSWVDIQPDSVTVAPGDTGKSFMYAGIPFEKEGRVKINVTGTGNEVRRSQEVQLVIDKKLKRAIESDKDYTTGAFGRAVSDFSKAIANAGSNTKVIGSIIAGLIITAAILLREW